MPAKTSQLYHHVRAHARHARFVQNLYEQGLADLATLNRALSHYQFWQHTYNKKANRS